MSVIRVDTAARRLRFGDLDMACEIGRGGPCRAEDKREGDGCTPLGRWPVRSVLLRPSRIALDRPPALPWRWLRAGDGWSDAPEDPTYNRPVFLPRATSAETLCRDDGAYNAIIVLGHNDTPPVPGMGSAIFLHMFEGRPTAGCVAVAPEDMVRLIERLTPGTVIEIG